MTNPNLRHLAHPVALCLATLALSACSTAPQSPTVDESTRRAANNPAAIELQACRNDLHNARLLASESTRLAEATTAAMHQWATARGALANTGSERPASTVFTFAFPKNASQLNLPEATSRAWMDEAKAAAWIVIRGRTDAVSDVPANAKAARDRAEWARDQMAAAGIDVKRMRLTWQASGDHVADNTTAEGKALNRRVEIELYRTAPTAFVDTPKAATPTAAAAVKAATPPANSRATESTASATAPVTP